MGTSALFSALNSLPMDEDEDGGDEDDFEGSSSDDDSPRAERAAAGRPTRPAGKFSHRSSMFNTGVDITAKRLGSSLHTIRPMSTQAEDDMVRVDQSDARRPANNTRSLNFPFRANTVARKARSPGPTEIQYQLAKSSLNEADAVPADASAEQGYFPKTEELEIRRSSAESEGSIGQPARAMMQDRIQKEENMGEEEEAEEISKATGTELEPVTEAPSRESGADNTSAALREGSGEVEVVEDRMMENPSEKKRLRREMLAEKLQDVFGLAEREEVIDEMRCWLLRSISAHHRVLRCWPY